MRGHMNSCHYRLEWNYWQLTSPKMSVILISYSDWVSHWNLKLVCSLWITCELNEYSFCCNHYWSPISNLIQKKLKIQSLNENQQQMTLLHNKSRTSSSVCCFQMWQNPRYCCILLTLTTILWTIWMYQRWICLMLNWIGKWKFN